MGLPFKALPSTSTSEDELNKPKKHFPVVQDETYTESLTDSSENEVDEQPVEQAAIPRYIHVTPTRRSQQHKPHQK